MRNNDQKNKLLFFTPPVILAAITLIWLFYKSGRWYYYRQEWQWKPLFVMHLFLPLFYLITLIVSIVRLVQKDKRSSSGVFYLVSSILMSVICFGGLLLFVIFTSGV